MCSPCPCEFNKKNRFMTNLSYKEISQWLNPRGTLCTEIITFITESCLPENRK